MRWFSTEKSAVLHGYLSDKRIFDFRGSGNRTFWAKEKQRVVDSLLNLARITPGDGGAQRHYYALIRGHSKGHTVLDTFCAASILFVQR
jgi:hypothetical protein